MHARTEQADSSNKILRELTRDEHAKNIAYKEKAEALKLMLTQPEFWHCTVSLDFAYPFSIRFVRWICNAVSTFMGTCE